MSYDLSGDFVEACDCSVICPCWLEEVPDDGHCTGLFAWSLAAGSRIEGVDVGGLAVVAVSVHSSTRRNGRTSTVLYIDERADRAQHDRLADAFAGRLDGPLAGLAEVSGDVVGARPARIELDPVRRKPLRGRPSSGWTLVVSVTPDPTHDDSEGDHQAAPVEVLRSTGAPLAFDDGPPITLQHTALSAELGIDTAPAGAGPAGTVTGQLGDELVTRVGELPGGYIEVTGRSGMRGTFGYHHIDTGDLDDAGGRAAPDTADGPAVPARRPRR